MNCKRPSIPALATFLGLALGIWFPANASADSGTSGRQPHPESETIQITADLLVSDAANNRAEFSGNVTARQGDTLITADRLTVYFSKTTEVDAVSPAQSLEKLIATGNVEIKFDNRLAVARQAVYITAERILTLIGPNAAISSGENTISGETITFYRADGRFTVEGGGGRVKAVILPEGAGLD